MVIIGSIRSEATGRVGMLLGKRKSNRIKHFCYYHLSPHHFCLALVQHAKCHAHAFVISVRIAACFNSYHCFVHVLDDTFQWIEEVHS